MSSFAASAWIRRITRWGGAQRDLIGLFLVGSYGQGTARVSSDIDLVLVVDDPARFLIETSWVNAFGPIERIQVENWGLLNSVRVWYVNGPEVEFGITGRNWLGAPLDAGTRRVLENGYQLLFDRDGTMGLASRGIAPSSRRNRQHPR